MSFITHQGGAGAGSIVLPERRAPLFASSRLAESRRRIFGINYTTYASYLRRDVSHLPDQPEVAETVRRLDEILNK